MYKFRSIHRPLLTVVPLQYLLTLVVYEDYSADLDYSFIMLDRKLEYELHKLGWNGNVDSSIDPSDAYKFIYDKMKKEDSRMSIKESKLGNVVTKVWNLVGIYLKLWDKKDLPVQSLVYGFGTNL
jgi:hypothetical protein